MAPADAAPGQDKARSATQPRGTLLPPDVERRQELTTAAYATIIRNYDTPEHVSGSFAQHIIQSFPSEDRPLVLRGIVIETPKVNAGCREAKALLPEEEKTQTTNLAKRRRTDELSRISMERLDTAWGGQDVPQMVIKQMSRITTILEPKGRRFLHSLWGPGGLLREMVQAGRRAPYFSGDRATEALERVKQTWGESSRRSTEGVDGEGAHHQRLENQVTFPPSADYGTGDATNLTADATEEVTLELGRGDLSHLASDRLSDTITDCPPPIISRSEIQPEVTTSLQLPSNTEIIDMASPKRLTMEHGIVIAPDITEQEASDHQLLSMSHFSRSGPSNTGTCPLSSAEAPRTLKNAMGLLPDQSGVSIQHATMSPADPVNSPWRAMSSLSPRVKRKRNTESEDLIDPDGESLSDWRAKLAYLDSAQASRTILWQLTTEERLDDDVLDLCCRAIQSRYDKSRSMLLLHPLWFFDDAHSDTLPSEECPRQKDNWSCGVWVLACLQRTMQGKSCTSCAHDVTPMAKKEEVLSLLMSVDRSDFDETSRAVLGSLTENIQSCSNRKRPSGRPKSALSHLVASATFEQRLTDLSYDQLQQCLVEAKGRLRQANQAEAEARTSIRIAQAQEQLAANFRVLADESMEALKNRLPQRAIGDDRTAHVDEDGDVGHFLEQRERRAMEESRSQRNRILIEGAHCFCLSVNGFGSDLPQRLRVAQDQLASAQEGARAAAADISKYEGTLEAKKNYEERLRLGTMLDEVMKKHEQFKLAAQDGSWFPGGMKP
ncbi:hypothetical protein LRP88_00091 [Fusarium phalaenopsidis]